MKFISALVGLKLELMASLDQESPSLMLPESISLILQNFVNQRNECNFINFTYFLKVSHILIV
jgi:hypothetical protein